MDWLLVFDQSRWDMPACTQKERTEADNTPSQQPPRPPMEK